MLLPVLWVNTDDCRVAWFLVMSLGVDKTSVFEEGLQLFRRIDRHAIHNVGPHGIGINGFHHDDELTTMFQTRFTSCMHWGMFCQKYTVSTAVTRSKCSFS